mgnify:CR=1 FL=1
MNINYKCVTTVDGIRDYIGGRRIVAFDFETAPDDPYREEDKAALDPATAHIVGCSSMSPLPTVSAQILIRTPFLHF